MFKKTDKLAKRIARLEYELRNIEVTIRSVEAIIARIKEEELLHEPLTNLSKMEGLKEAKLPIRELIDAIMEHLGLEPRQVETFVKLHKKP